MCAVLQRGTFSSNLTHRVVPVSEWVKPPSETHVLTLVLSPTTLRWSAGKRSGIERVVRGDVGLCPIDEPGILSVDRTTETLELNLPVELLRAASVDQLPEHKIELKPTMNLRDPRLSSLLLSLASEIREGSASGTLFFESMNLAIATYVLAHHGSFKPNVQKLRGGLSPHLLKRTLDYIHEQSSADLHLGDMARLCCLSSSQFSKSFRESVGMSPYQFVLQDRIRKAENLLRAKDASIGEIARVAGFKSQQHFAFVFRRFTGYSPSNYRSRL